MVDGAGETALHVVARQGSLQAYRLLVQYGADKTLPSPALGLTPPQLAPDSMQKVLRGEWHCC